MGRRKKKQQQRIQHTHVGEQPETNVTQKKNQNMFSTSSGNLSFLRGKGYRAKRQNAYKNKKDETQIRRFNSNKNIIAHRERKREFFVCRPNREKEAIRMNNTTLHCCAFATYTMNFEQVMRPCASSSSSSFSSSSFFYSSSSTFGDSVVFSGVHAVTAAQCLYKHTYYYEWDIVAMCNSVKCNITNKFLSFFLLYGVQAQKAIAVRFSMCSTWLCFMNGIVCIRNELGTNEREKKRRIQEHTQTIYSELIIVLHVVVVRFYFFFGTDKSA